MQHTKNINFSYWEKESFTNYDYIIIGAGIVGLSTAIELKEKFSASTVLVLERGFLPAGASTRNAGFACMGSVTELSDDLIAMKEDEVIRLFELRKKGLERLRKRLGDSNIGYAERGSYELINGNGPDVVERIEYLNKLLLPVTKKPAFALANSKIQEFGFSTNYTRSLVANLGEGELNTGKMMRALIDLTLQKGIEIKTGSEVINFEEKSDSVSVEIKIPFTDEKIKLDSKVLVICTNAFTKQLLPDEELQNLDFVGETTTDFGLNEVIQADLENKLREIVIPGTNFSVEYRWSGIMAFGPTKYPLVKPISNRVFGVFRLGGMGVALGSEVAAQLADLIEGNEKNN